MPIPRILHVTWKGDKLPRLFKRVFEAWRQTHPEWDIRFYTDADVRAFVVEHYPGLLPTFDAYPAGIFRADAFRFFVLHRIGGVYADLDVLPFGPIDSILEETECFVGAEPEQHVLENDAKYRGMPFLLCNAFMGSVPGHPFFARCIERLEACACSDVIDATGPRFVNGVALNVPREIRPSVLLPNYWSPLTNKGPPSSTSGAYADAIERHFHVIGRDERPIVSHLWRNSWVLPIGYKGPYFWRWPNHLEWATRRWRFPEMAKIRVKPPSVDYDDQRLIAPDPLPRLIVGFDLGTGQGAAVERWLARQSYPRELLEVGLFGAHAALLRERLAAQGFAVTLLPGSSEFANAVLDRAADFDGCAIVGPSFEAAPDDAVLQLVSARRPVVSGYSIDADGREQNPRGFLYHANLFKYLFRQGGRDGVVRDVDSGNRLPLRHSRALTIAPMTSVGADFLYVDRAVIDAGVRFPKPGAPYKLHTGSTGFALMARDRGFEVCALPNLEVVVAP